MNQPVREESAGSGTVSRALHLLRVLAEEGGTLSVKQVSHRLGLPPSTSHRLLQLLRQDGFVDSPQSGQYVIGPQFLRVASLVVGNSSIVARAQEAIRHAADAFNEAVVFGLYLPTEGALSFECRADGQQRLTYQIDMHRPMSLIWGASGKAVLAFIDQALVAEILDVETVSPARGTPKPTLDALHEELERIRQQGWAASRGEKLPDACGIAAPVFDLHGVIGSLCLTIPESRMDRGKLEEYGRAMAEHARRLSYALGGRA